MLTRRFPCWCWLGAILSIAFLGYARTAAAESDRPHGEANRVIEITFTAAKDHDDPFNRIDLDVAFTGPNSRPVRVPAFWAGGKVWRVRYASPTVGVHRYVTTCTDAGDRGLHGVAGEVEVRPYQGENVLYRHGPLRVAADRRHLAHADGTPFLWLGDTWWMGLCERLRWPDEFKTLTADRKAKGFNVIQIVAGLYPDMAAFDARGRNEAGFPWEKDYARIRPEYFDLADRRLEYLVDQGLVPCVVMAWGYHLPWLGPEKMKRHVRYVMARYGALPVVWCIAGEVNLPYYLDKGFPKGGEPQAKGWEAIIQYARGLNGFGRLITVHPTGLEPLSGRLLYADQSLLDFDMLQTGHGLRDTLLPTMRALRASYEARPTMPVINGEVCYEGLLGRIPADIPRLMFYTNVLAGAAGHTYGANGIWQLNRRNEPYGKSPHGGDYGAIPWDEAMSLPGSQQLGFAKRLLEQYPWHRFEPHAEWASWAKGQGGVASRGDWIWFPEGDPAKDAPEEARFFRKTFDLPQRQPVVTAALWLTVDDRFTAYLNGHELGSHADWRTGREFADVGPLLRPGTNVLAVRGENGPGPKGANPAGLAAGLEIHFDDDTKTSVVSGGSWRSSVKGPPGWQGLDFEDKDWKPALVVAHFGEGPWAQQAGVKEEVLVPYAAGIPGAFRMIYVPDPRPITVHKLERDKRYFARYFDPVAGTRTDLGAVAADPKGSWVAAPPRGARADWVLLLDTAEATEHR